MAERWRRRGSVALLAVALAFFIFPLLPQDDVVNSDWPAFATGARLIVSDPGHLYDLSVQQRVEGEVTGGRILVTPGIHGILPFLAPAWVAFFAVPFDALGTGIGGRLWVLFGLACLLAGLYLAIRPRPAADILPAFAGVPTALVMLNAQLDGIVVLGVGAAISLWPRRYLAGFALALTLVKPQLVLPLGAAVILAREWKVLAGWAVGGIVLLTPTLALNPGWIGAWWHQTQATVAPVSREVDVAHFGVFLSGAAVAAIVVVAVGLIVYLAWRIRGQDMRPAIAVLVIGGVISAPHALPADLVMVAAGLAIWGRATWPEWLALSVGAVLAALTPAPVPAAVGVVLVGGLLARVSLWPSPAPARESPR
jgi:hypothetical protein